MDETRTKNLTLLRRDQPPVTLEAIDRRLDALQEMQTTIIAVLRAIVTGQGVAREAIILLGENLRAEFRGGVTKAELIQAAGMEHSERSQS